MAASFAAAMLVGGAHAAAAQEPPGPAATGAVAGTVTTTVGGEPLAYSGVVIAALGRERLAGARGAFRLDALPPGTHRVRVRRLGYRPVDTTVTVHAGRTSTLHVRLAPAAVRLATVRVLGDAGCRAPGPPDPAADPEFARLFEQVRQNAEQFRTLARAHPFGYTMHRELGRRRADGLVRRTRVDTVAYRGDTAATYRPGRLLERQDGGTRLVLPTLLELADSTFLATHCFRYAGADTADGAPAVRVAFRADARLRTPDIDGVVVLDSATYQVRRLDVRLTRVPTELAEVRAVSARTTFRDVRPGIPIFARITGTSTLRAGDDAEPAAELDDQQLAGVRFLAGDPDAPDQATPGVRGVVVDSAGGGAPLAGAMVQLVLQRDVAVAHMAAADSAGRFALPAVPPGRYLAGFFHPTVDTYGLEAPVVAVDVGAGGVDALTLAVPPAERLLALLCPAQPRSDSAGVVLGTVREADAPVSGARVVVSWVGAADDGGPRTALRQLVVTSGEGGRYVACGVPVGPAVGPVTVRAVVRGRAIGAAAVRVPPRGLARRDLTVAAPGRAAAAAQR